MILVIDIFFEDCGCIFIICFECNSLIKEEAGRSMGKAEQVEWRVASA